LNWSDVGTWIKGNAGSGASLVGSLLTGNVPGAIAAGIALVGSATGTSDPAQALAALQADPSAIIKLKELANQEQASIRQHIQQMEMARLNDEQAEHTEQQQTIRSGDNSGDEYVRQTRPMMARQSWYATMTYIIGFEAATGLKLFDSGANWDLAMILLAPAAAYLGFRSFDKWSTQKP